VGDERATGPLTNLASRLFDGADAIKRDLVDYSTRCRPIVRAARRPLSVVGALRGRRRHAKTCPGHPRMGSSGWRCGRRARNREYTHWATTAAPCSGSPTSGRGVTSHLVRADRWDRATHLVLGPDRRPSRRMPSRSRVRRAAGAGGADRPGALGRGETSGQRACTCSSGGYRVFPGGARRAPGHRRQGGAAESRAATTASFREDRAQGVPWTRPGGGATVVRCTAPGASGRAGVLPGGLGPSLEQVSRPTSPAHRCCPTPRR